MFTIVISGVNLTEGGILSILTDCLKSLLKINTQLKCRVIVLVHSKSLVTDYLNNFEIYEFPKAKTAWWRRIKFEYFDSNRLSEKFQPDLWISLHDMTPNVKCNYQVVYCHNPSPFYHLKFKDFLVNYKFTLFNIFYKYLYAINIKRNKYVIVQQNWLRDEFARRYGVKTIVAYPEANDLPVNDTAIKNKRYTFFYPAFPRIFKNFEVILKATELLSKKRDDFDIILTIDGNENTYSRKLKNGFTRRPNIHFIGLQTRNQVFNLYKQTDCLLFPSKLETWGLPLSEIKLFNKPVIVSDLGYAHETIGDYNYVKFFEPDNFHMLSAYMDQAIDAKLYYDDNKFKKPADPFFSEWDQLLSFLVNDALLLISN